MSVPTLPTVDPNATLEELRNQVAILQKTITFYLTSNLSSDNAYEFGGWLVGLDSLMSDTGTVGLSSAITGANDIRIWAGNSIPDNASFRVYEDGTMFATNGHFTGAITGSTITSGSSIDIGTDARIGNTLYLNETSATSKGIIFSTASGNSARISVLSGDMSIITDGFITLTMGSGQGLVVNGVVNASSLKSNTITNQFNVPVVFSGSSTSSYTQPNHNHGIPPGTKLLDADGITQWTWVESGGFTHSHSI